MIEQPSPNFDSRAAPVDMLLIHYTGMKTGAEALQRLCDPGAKVSAHYLIEEDGEVYRLVGEDKRAWHAGLAWWAGETDINSRAVGIELVNPGHEFGYREFAEPQMISLLELAGDIVHRHKIAPARVLGHSDVAPWRKEDPGEKFDWRRLAENGVGLWPRGDAAPAPDPATALATIGYRLEEEGDERSSLIAFQRHYCQHRWDGEADEKTRRALTAIAAAQT